MSRLTLGVVFALAVFVGAGRADEEKVPLDKLPAKVLDAVKTKFPKADLVSEFACRLLKYMDARGYDTCVPVNDDPAVTPQPLLDFQAGYVLRAIDDFPRAGSRVPWRLGQSYAHDVVTLRHGKIDDGSMRFARAVTPSVR